MSVTIGQIKNEVGTTVCKMYKSTAYKRANELRNHKHVEFEISLIMDGEGVYNTTGGNIDIKSGDVLIFSTNEFHCITDIYTDSMEILNLHFQPSFVWDIGSSYISNGYLNIFFNRNERFSNRLDRDNPHVNAFAEKLLNVKKEFEEKNYDYEAQVKLEILQLMINLRRNFNLTDETKTTEVSARDYSGIKRAMNFIDTNYLEDISLEQIAKQSFLSKSYFCTIFKKLNGLSPWDYINIKRINKAIDLLKSTDLSILDIATRSGYNSTANFNKIFRSVTGLTPKIFRKD